MFILFALLSFYHFTLYGYSFNVVSYCGIQYNGTEEKCNLNNSKNVIEINRELTVNFTISLVINSKSFISSVSCDTCEELNYSTEYSFDKSVINKSLTIKGSLRILSIDGKELPVVINITLNGGNSYFPVEMFTLTSKKQNFAIKFNESAIFTDNGNIVSTKLAIKSNYILRKQGLNVSFPKMLIVEEINCSIPFTNIITTNLTSLMYTLNFEKDFISLSCLMKLLIMNISNIKSNHIFATIQTDNKHYHAVLEIKPNPVFAMISYWKNSFSVGSSAVLNFSIHVPEIGESLDLFFKLIEDLQGISLIRFNEMFVLNNEKQLTPNNINYLNISYKQQFMYITMNREQVLTPITTYQTYNFSLLFDIPNNTLLLTGRTGNISCLSGTESIFNIPFQITGLVLQPDVVTWKHAEVLGADQDIVLFTLNVTHTPFSSNNAYGIEVFDYINGLYVTEYPRQSTNIEIKRNGLLDSSLRIQIGFLKVGSVYVVKYKAKFLSAYKDSTIQNKIETFWGNGQVNSRAFGPSSDLVCLMKDTSYQDSFIYNYGYIFLGIFCGILLGILVLVFVILCCRKHPSTQKYILHRNEVHSYAANDDELYLSPPPYQDMETKFDKPMEKNIMSPKDKFFSKFNFSKMKRVKRVDPCSPPTKDNDQVQWFEMVLENKLTASLLNLEKYQSSGNDWFHLKVLSLAFYKSIHSSLLLFYSKLLDTNRISINVKNKLVQDLDTLNSTEFKHQVNEAKSDKENIATLWKNLYNLFQQFESMCTSHIDNVMKQKKNKKKQKAVDTKMKEKKKELIKQLKEEFSLLVATSITKFLDEIYFDSGVSLKFYQTNVALSFVMAYLQIFLSSLMLWIKAIVRKEVDLFKRKQLITDNCYTEFVLVFNNEINHVMKHIDKEKIVICQNQTNAFIHDLEKNLTDNLRNFENKEDIKEYIRIKEDIVLKISNSFGLMLTKIIDMTRQTLHVCTVRLENHAVEIHNKRIEIPDIATDTESLSGTPIELYNRKSGNKLQALIKNIQSQVNEEIENEHNMLQQLLTLVKERTVDFNEFFKDSLVYKQKQKKNVFVNNILLMRIKLSNQLPTTYEQSLKVVHESQLFSLQQLIHSFRTPSIIKPYHQLFEKLQNHDENVIQLLLLRKNMSSFYKKIEKCIEFVYKTAQAHVVESHDFNISAQFPGDRDSLISLLKQVHEQRRFVSQTSAMVNKYAQNLHENEKIHDAYMKSTKTSIEDVMEDFTTRETHQCDNEVEESLVNFVWFLQLIGFERKNADWLDIVYDNDLIVESMNDADMMKKKIDKLSEYGIQCGNQNVSFLKYLRERNDGDWSEISNTLLLSSSRHQIDSHFPGHAKQELFESSLRYLSNSRQGNCVVSRRKSSKKKRLTKKNLRDE